MNKSKGELISETFAEYKLNFKTYFSIILFLSLIPSLLLLGFTYLFGKEAYNISQNPEISKVISLLFTFIIPTFLFSIVIIALSLLIYTSITYNAFYKKKVMGVKESLMGVCPKINPENSIKKKAAIKIFVFILIVFFLHIKNSYALH